MRKISMFVLMMALTAVPMAVYAQVAGAADPQAVVTSSADIIEVGNKICPVSNEPVGSMGAAMKATHKGKVYNFCCSMCTKDFNNDPEKFAKIADDEVAAEAETATK